MGEHKAITAALSDEELAAEFRQGKTEAFNLLVGRYKNALVNYIFRYTGSYDDADDLAQETFVRVYQHIDQYKPVAKFSTWLYTIATNLARTHYQKRKRWGFFPFGKTNEEDEQPTDMPDSQLLPDELADGSILQEHIEAALNELPQQFREVVILFEIEEKSYDEICEITGLNIGTVKSRLNRGRARLQELLKEVAGNLH